MSRTDVITRIRGTLLDELPAHEAEIKLGLWHLELHDLRQRAADLERMARVLREEESKTRECITRVRKRLGVADAPIPDFSREEKGHA